MVTIRMNKHTKFHHIAEGLAFSTVLMWFTSGLKVIDPRTTGWLSIGDATAEIAWEFFRRTPFLKFPLGVNPDYGLEISSTVALDGQIPLFSLLIRPFSSFLPERFQYLGLFLFITFLLNYYFAKKIFIHLQLNNIQSGLSAVILATSPIILNRYIENTHYSLTSSWLIFSSILLVLQHDFRYYRWFYIFTLTVLIHMYYLPFVFIIYIAAIIINSNNIKIIFVRTISLMSILILSVIIMYICGYFFSGTDSKDIGYGFFRSTLSSLIDPSGWSNILPDIPETEGSYEGFAYLGIPALLIIVTNLFLIKVSKKKKSKSSFISLWVAAIVLFIFSLSNNIAISDKELFSFPTVESFTFFTNTFRSTGRFSWLIVIVITISAIFIMSQKIDSKKFSTLLFIYLLIGIIDYFPQLISAKAQKFNLEYKSSLKDSAWSSVDECYSKMRMYPPTPGVENYYDFVTIAYSQNLAINTGRFGRINQNAILGSYDLMHQEFNSGKYRNDSLYIFTNAEYVSKEFVDFQKNLAIHTLNAESAYGEIDGYTFIAPNLKNCDTGDLLKLASKEFGSPKNQKYAGEKLLFGKDQDSSKYILSGFSAQEQWGVWSATDLSKIVLNVFDIEDFSYVNLVAKDLGYPSNQFEVSINGSAIGSCQFAIDFSTCTIPFNFKSLNTNIITLSFTPRFLRSPKDIGLSNESQNLGFGLQTLYLN